MNLSELMRYMADKSGAVVNIHALHPAFYNSESLKLAPDQYLHHGPYCIYAKMHGESGLCQWNKARSIAKARKGKIFHGLCSNGVWDLCCPIILNGNLLAVAYLGHFRKPDHPLRNFPHHKFTQQLPEITSEKIRELTADAEFIAEFVRIEVDRFLKAGGMGNKRRDDEFYAENSRRFIDSKYRENITLKELADTLGMNPNYLGALLKRYYGRSFREMLNHRRVNEAMVYLKLHRDMSVSRIAVLCGFSDSNYFSVVFRQLTGMPPSAWRNAPDLPENHKDS